MAHSSSWRKSLPRSLKYYRTNYLQEILTFLLKSWNKWLVVFQIIKSKQKTISIVDLLVNVELLIPNVRREDVQNGAIAASMETASTSLTILERCRQIRNELTVIRRGKKILSLDELNLKETERHTFPFSISTRFYFHRKETTHETKNAFDLLEPQLLLVHVRSTWEISDHSLVCTKQTFFDIKILKPRKLSTPDKTIKRFKIKDSFIQLNHLEVCFLPTYFVTGNWILQQSPDTQTI